MNWKNLRKLLFFGGAALLVFYGENRYFDSSIGIGLYKNIKIERNKTIYFGQSVSFDKKITVFEDGSSFLKYVSSRGNSINIVSYFEFDGDGKVDIIRRDELLFDDVYREDMRLKRYKDYKDNPDWFRSADALLEREFREIR